MRKIYFLILNYCTMHETMKCVMSIDKLEAAEYTKEIVIIDNCSPDNSYNELVKVYQNRDNIIIYQTHYNMGFSKGNNFGYELIRKNRDSEFVIVCNSDIEFRQIDFLNLLIHEHAENHFELCGPDVFCEGDFKKSWRGHQSPAYPWEYKKAYVKFHMKYNAIKLEYCKNNCSYMKYYVTACLNKILNIFLGLARRTIYRKYRLQKHDNIPFHGSCIIVSKYFIDNEEKLFEPETKFYGEELLLYLKAQKANYRLAYIPTLKVWHMQGRSSAKYRRGGEGDLFIYENLRDSDSVYLDELAKIQQHLPHHSDCFFHQ